ncbi:MAG TPA: glutamyl-tRNA reductase [Chloroflexi bacterium]|nr:glutamyl-tRNA reductase [Chloroflexota bacterium]
MGNHQLHILCLGLSHQTASVSLREQLAFTPHRLESSLARLGCGDPGNLGEIRELVILSTCNRVELYAATASDCFSTLENFLTETQNIPLDQITPLFYRLQGKAAIQHLLNVSAGLDSVVLGEPQILGQVTDAYSIARKHGTVGKILSRLFQTAIQAGKRARTETTISHNPASVASVAVKLISQSVPDLEAAKIMILGAGEMAELAVEALRKRGAIQITVVNRTLQHAQELAQRWGGQAASLEMLLNLLPDTDIVITSTGAPHTILQTSMIAPVMETRPSRPLVLMDIAVPRDVDIDVAEIPGVSLFDMDTLTAKLENALAQRVAEVPYVEAILAEELDCFLEYLATLDVVPLIIKMHQRADEIRQAELEKTIRRIPDLPPDTQQQIDVLTKSIVNKILHSPTIRLREEASGPNAIDYADIARGLFGLD